MFRRPAAEWPGKNFRVTEHLKVVQHLSDEELIAQLRAGGSSSSADPYLNELFQRHQRKVALWCLRYTPDRERAADLAQEILARAWRNLDSFQGNSKFTTWLFMVCRNHCLNQVKARPGDLISELPYDLADNRSGDLDDAIGRQRQWELAQRWMDESLNEMERKVVSLHFGDEMPVEAITRLLGLSNTSGAKAYLVSARRKLQESARRWKARQTSGKQR